MPEMSGKCKLNPIKTNNLIYIMIFFWGGGGYKNLNIRANTGEMH